MSRRKVPVAGVRWEDEDDAVPDSIRRCKICHQPIEHLAPSRVCCGHPRCARINRGLRNKTVTKEQIAQLPRSPAQIESEILSRIRFAQARGASQLQAVEWTARKMNISTGQVMSTMNRKS